MYCQRDIEDQSICDKQCDHCRVYYFPLELEHAACDFADENVDKNSVKETHWNGYVDAFKAGALFMKNHLKNETQSV